eukprot:TRINITY_DN7125_c3_g1_i1.p1 TRINITY_DN7125_c3_g1~~TRINITY_DN7125_c3_g1_i1.p1  ORF type:complete len:739 (+),score=128.52 TRINITY_DN7125_c3_g1_i1:76-2292(+)
MDQKDVRITLESPALPVLVYPSRERDFEEEREVDSESVYSETSWIGKDNSILLSKLDEILEAAEKWQDKETVVERVKSLKCLVEKTPPAPPPPPPQQGVPEFVPSLLVSLPTDSSLSDLKPPPAVRPINREESSDLSKLRATFNEFNAALSLNILKEGNNDKEDNESSYDELTSLSPTRDKSLKRYSTVSSFDYDVVVKDEHRFVTNAQLESDRFVLNFNRFDRYWQPLLFLTLLFITLSTGLTIGLGRPASLTTAICDNLADVVMYVEIFFNLHRPVNFLGLITTDTKSIRARYYKGKDGRYLAYDVIAMLPLHIVGWSMGDNESYFRSGVTGYYSPVWRANRLLLALYTSEKFVRTLQVVFEDPVFERIGKSIFKFAYIATFVGSGWCWLQLYEGEQRSLAWNNSVSVFFKENVSVFQQFTLGVDYAIKAMAGMSRGSPVPHTDTQTAFEQIVACIGVCTYATIIATIGTQLKTSGTFDELKSSLDEIHDAMAYKQLPKNMYREAKRYCWFMFQNQRLRGTVGDTLSDLPTVLQLKVDQFVGADALFTIPVLKCAFVDVAFLHFMIDRLEVIVFYEGESVYCKGDWCDCMYFITSGSVHVTNEDGTEKTLRTNDSVGELALFHVHQRVETVVALEHSSCFALYRSSFKEAEVKFPEAVASIKKNVQKKLQNFHDLDAKRRRVINYLLELTDRGLLQCYFEKLKSYVAIAQLSARDVIRRSTTNMRIKSLKRRLVTC